MLNTSLKWYGGGGVGSEIHFTMNYMSHIGDLVDTRTHDGEVFSPFQPFSSGDQF